MLLCLFIVFVLESIFLRDDVEARSKDDFDVFMVFMVSLFLWIDCFMVCFDNFNGFRGGLICFEVNFLWMFWDFFFSNCLWEGCLMDFCVVFSATLFFFKWYRLLLLLLFMFVKFVYDFKYIKLLFCWV